MYIVVQNIPEKKFFCCANGLLTCSLAGRSASPVNQIHMGILSSSNRDPGYTKRDLGQAENYQQITVKARSYRSGSAGVPIVLAYIYFHEHSYVPLTLNAYTNPPQTVRLTCISVSRTGNLLSHFYRKQISITVFRITHCLKQGANMNKS